MAHGHVHACPIGLVAIVIAALMDSTLLVSHVSPTPTVTPTLATPMEGKYCTAYPTLTPANPVLVALMRPAIQCAHAEMDTLDQRATLALQGSLAIPTARATPLTLMKMKPALLLYFQWT